VDIWVTTFICHLSNNFPIDPKIYVDNWPKLTTFGYSTSTIHGGKLNDKDNHLHDQVQKYSIGEITYTLGF
jgi:hypothetical protein